MDNKQRIYNENPETNANFFSKLFLCWISPLMTLGQTKPIEEKDLYKPLAADKTETVTNKLEREWKKELSKKKPSLANAMTRVWIRRTLLTSILVLISESIRVVQPILFQYLIKYFNGHIDFQSAILYGTVICINTIIIGLLDQPFYEHILSIGMQMKIATSGLIYRKVLKLDTSKSKSVINLLSTECSSFERALVSVPYLIIGPLQLISIIILLIELVDWTILCGLLLLFLCIPFQWHLGKILKTYKKKTKEIANKRTDLTLEILNGIKIVKMYCWEEPMRKIIASLRRKELLSRSMQFLISVINTSIDRNLADLMTLASISIFVIIASKPLLPGFVVIIMGYYAKLCDSIAKSTVSGYNSVMSLQVSCKLIQDLLLKEEIHDSVRGVATNTNSVIRVDKLSASWSQQASGVQTLQNISFKVRQNGLLAVVGEVGAGKSSLLKVLLNEIPSIKGTVKLNGSVCYVSQEPWIFSSTIKQNILFGKEYSMEKFEDIIRVCALKDDLKMLPNGENTLIGDNGVNLSGGQKARVNLARALYHDPDIYLFDDPLSAVDAGVAKHLFENCINGYLNSKVRILVTHQVHYLEKVDQIIVLKDGKIQAKGKYVELAHLLTNLKNIEFQTQVSELSLSRQTSEANANAQEETETSSLLLPKTVELSSQLSRESKREQHVTSSGTLNENPVCEVEQETTHGEARVTGTINCSIYKELFNFGLASVLPVLVLLLYIVAQAAMTSSDYWLTYWATQEEEFMFCGGQSNNKSMNFTNLTSGDCGGGVFHSREQYFIIYSILTLASVLLVLLRSFAFFGSSLLAAKSFHKKLFDSIIKAKARFFDITPIGRIAERFTKDILTVDSDLPRDISSFLDLSVIISSSIIVAVIVNYWILIPIAIFSVVIWFVRKYYANVSREIKRIEARCRSPITIHATNTLSGIETIRACKAQQKLLSEFNVHSDYHTQANYALLSIGRWFAVRINTIVSIYSCILIYSCIFLNNYLRLTPGQVGILLVYIFKIMNMLQWTVRLSTDVENMMTSVERIREYSTIDGEKFGNSQNERADWPSNGKIEFQNVSFKYDADLPPALKNISMTIKAHAMIGIVGRTGAGKSSIIQALYRMGDEIGGRILIDDIDIKDVELGELRRKLAIIPQEPFLFSGTIRYNLDPFGLSDDNKIWKILEIVQLKEKVSGMESGLHSQIKNEKGDTKLSVGEKQLFCLARALLKKSKILIIDEATANVDLNTDALVQKAIREHFTECTVIAIAHRLQTIMDYDRIICLSGGELINYGTPVALLQDKNSILYELAHNLGESEVQRLRGMASKAAINRQ